MTQSYTDMDISNQTAISPDTKVLAALKLDGILTTYNLKTGKKIKEFPKIPDFSNDFPGTFGKAKAMVYSPKGKSVGICGFKNNVYLLDTTNGNSRILADKFPCDTLNFSPDGSRLITGSEKGNISLFDVKSGKVLHSIKISGKLKQVGFNAKGNRVFATSKNKLDNVIIWGSKKFKEESRIQVCDAVALGIDASLSQAVFICDTELSHYAIKSGTQTLLRNAYRHNYLTNKEVIFSPNGDQFMVGSYFTKELRFFNVEQELENPKL